MRRKKDYNRFGGAEEEDEDNVLDMFKGEDSAPGQMTSRARAKQDRDEFLDGGDYSEVHVIGPTPEQNYNRRYSDFLQDSDRLAQSGGRLVFLPEATVEPSFTIVFGRGGELRFHVYVKGTAKPSIRRVDTKMGVLELISPQPYYTAWHHVYQHYNEYYSSMPWMTYAEHQRYMDMGLFNNPPHDNGGHVVRFDAENAEGMKRKTLRTTQQPTPPPVFRQPSPQHEARGARRVLEYMEEEEDDEDYESIIKSICKASQFGVIFDHYVDFDKFSGLCERQVEAGLPEFEAVMIVVSDDHVVWDRRAALEGYFREKPDATDASRPLADRITMNIFKGYMMPLMPERVDNPPSVMQDLLDLFGVRMQALKYANGD
jgi:hypothetical protein